MKFKLLLFSLFCAAGCLAQEKLIIANEGMWQADNGRLSYFEDGTVVSNKWFQEVNKYPLGDTPNDIIQINDTLIAIAINWSNIVQFIDLQGHAIAATEDVPNNRKLATDGRYVYITSYGHEVGLPGTGFFKEFEKGYVAKIDVSTFKLVDAVEVGYEPEGIAYYNGYLFVANTGGYAFQEPHDYETTVSVINAETMELVRNVDTQQINLYGKMSMSGQYLCINSPGDYYEIPAATIIFDCQAALDDKPDDECFYSLEYAATYNTVDLDGYFYAIGSRYSYYTGEYTFNYIKINPEELFDSEGGSGVEENEFPGDILSYLMNMSMPYGIYVNPYTGYFYATDASDFASGGALYQWTKEGDYIGKYDIYMNPGHFLALPPYEVKLSIGYEVADTINPIEEEITLHPGDSIHLHVGYAPSEARISDISLANFNPDVVSLFADGSLKALSTGSAVIEASAKFVATYPKTSIKVTVEELPAPPTPDEPQNPDEPGKPENPEEKPDTVTPETPDTPDNPGNPGENGTLSLSIAVKSMTISKDSLVTLIATFAPDSEEEPEVVWSSSKEDVAYVNHCGTLSATVTALAIGETDIRVEHAEKPEIFDTCHIIVIEPASDAVDAIFDDDDESADIFDINGRIVRLNADKEFIRSLKNGIYVIRSAQNTKTVIIK